MNNTRLNLRQSLAALTCGSACASHGNPDVRNDLVELINKWWNQEVLSYPRGENWLYLGVRTCEPHGWRKTKETKHFKQYRTAKQKLTNKENLVRFLHRGKPRKLGHGVAFYKILTLGAHIIAKKRNLLNQKQPCCTSIIPQALC